MGLILFHSQLNNLCIEKRLSSIATNVAAATKIVEELVYLLSILSVLGANLVCVCECL